MSNDGGGIIIGTILLMGLIGLWVYLIVKSCVRAFFDEKMRYLTEKRRWEITDKRVYGTIDNQPNDEGK